FRGKVTLGALEHLGLSSATLNRLELLDEHGASVLLLEGVHLRYRPWQWARAWLSSPDTPLRFEHVRIERSRVALRSDAETQAWSLARALQSPRPPSARRPKPPVHYAFEAIELGEVAVSVEHPSIGQVAATVHHLQGSADLEGTDANIALERFGLRLVAPGDVPLDGTGSFRLLPHGYAAGTFHGFVDGTEVDLALELDGAQLTARADVPHALPERLQRRWPSWPLQHALSAHLTAKGPVRAPRVEAHLESGTSRIDATGSVQLGASLQARLSVEAHALDARLLWPKAPATELEARAELELEQTAQGLLVRAQGTSAPTRIAELELPGTRFSVRVEPEQTLGTLELESARGQLRAEIRAAAPGTARLDVQAQRVDLRAWPELRGLGGTLKFEAHADLQQARLSGTLDGTLSNLETGPAAVRQTRLRGGWSGSINDWDGFELETALTASGLRWGTSKFERGSWSSRGKWSRSRFDAELFTASGARSGAHGVLEVGAAGATFRDLDATWSERELELSAHASLLAPARGELHIERFQIGGAAGKLRGAARIQPGAVEINLDADRLDTGRLSRTLGAGDLGHSGNLTGHAELSTDARATRGNVDVQLRNLGVRDLALGTLDLRATLQERSVELSLRSSESPLGRLEARATGTLAGPVLEPASWERATGDGSVTLKQLPLWPVGLLLPRRGAVQNLAGQLELALQVERRAAQELPSVFLQASTQELSFSLDASRDGKPAPITFDQFALHASASLDGSSGHGAATVLVTDSKGALVTSSGSVELHLARLIANPRSVVEQLLHTPIDALLRLHARPLSQLPAPLSVPDLAGSVEATLQLAGTLSEPTLDLAVEGRGLLGSFAAGSDALSVSGLLHYVPGSGELTGRAQATRAGAGLVSARLEGRVREPAAATTGPFALAGRELSELRAAAMLNGVPLELWPAAAREHFQGKLYGSVAVERHGSELRPSAYVEIGGLSVSGRALGSGHFRLEGRDALTRAELDIGPVEHRLRARIEARPGSAGVEGSLTANDFDVASLSPFVSDILSHLDGTVDASASFQLRPRPDAAYYLGINGHAELKAARLHLDLLGLQLEELGATLRARSTPDHTVILIDPVQAKSRSRQANVEADAELWLEGVRLVSGEARVKLNDVPLSLKSALRGTARGRLEGQLERKPDFMALTVKVPTLRLALPASTTRSLITLDPNPDFHVAEVNEAAPPRASDALLWKIAFELGNAVRVERADLSLPLSGDPRLEYRDEVRPSGSIELRPGGRINLFDQNFSVDHGSLSFDPDAAENPRLDVTASWRAPDGTTVYVDVTGRAQDVSVLTRDDRGLQDIDRFYLLTGNPSPGATSGAINSSESGISDRAALGQTVSLGINQLLRKSVGNVAVSVDTSTDDRASYSASVRLSDRL
ncbi:MAG TPA: translocation/assembly module TamB domain-containing protein, partial [Polyangiaceae bacterium]|nr:translocation/assembly module TamB domain-containing protein [Polyangiaceae bacterium]